MAYTKNIRTYALTVKCEQVNTLSDKHRVKQYKYNGT